MIDDSVVCTNFGADNNDIQFLTPPNTTSHDMYGQYQPPAPNIQHTNYMIDAFAQFQPQSLANIPVQGTASPPLQPQSLSNISVDGTLFQNTFDDQSTFESYCRNLGDNDNNDLIQAYQEPNLVQNDDNLDLYEDTLMDINYGM